MATQSGASSSPPQRWRPAPQAAEEHKKEKEKDRKFDAATSSGPRPYQPWSRSSGPRVPPVSKTASTGEPKQASSTSTRRGTDNATEATTHVPLSSTKASSAGTNSFAQHPASERTSSYARDSQSTTRTTTSRTDSSSNSPRSTSSIPRRRTEPTPPRTTSTDKATRSQKATVESDVDEDGTDSEVDKGSNRPPASTTHKPVSSKAVVDDTSNSEEAPEEQPMPSERHPRPYYQSVNERIALRPTTPTSDGTRSTRQDVESNDRKSTQEVEEARERLRQMNLKEDDLRQKSEAAKQRERERRELEERQKREAAEQRERERAKEEERQRAEAHARELREQREREKKEQEAFAKQQEFERREKEAKSRYQERKRTEDDEKERERRRRATGSSSGSGTPHQSSSGGGTSGFPGSPPPFGSFGSGFPASPASFSSAGSASTQNVAAAWEKYDKAWTTLPDKAAQGTLRWRDIPWPMVAPPSKSEDLVDAGAAIANFVLSPTHSQSKSPKKRIREALLRWHPDRFDSRWLPKCAENLKDREEIKTGVGLVIRCLNELLSVQGAFGSPP